MTTSTITFSRPLPGQALEPVSRARADYVFACMKTNGETGRALERCSSPSTSSRRSCRYVAAAFTRSGVRNASEIVMLTCRVVSFPSVSAGVGAQKDALPA